MGSNRLPLENKDLAYSGTMHTSHLSGVDSLIVALFTVTTINQALVRASEHGLFLIPKRIDHFVSRSEFSTR